MITNKQISRNKHGVKYLWISRLIQIIVLAGIMAISFGTANARTLIGDETWSGLESLTENVIVPSGITLTIDPGTIVEFSAGAGIELLIDGTLIANGILGNEITFTSNSGTPLKGDWTWIRFSSTGGGSIMYSRIEYANTGVMSSNTSLTLSNNTFESNNYGINSYGSSSLIENNVFSNNDFGISCNDSSAVIKMNYFYNNTNDGINISGTSSGLSVLNNVVYSNGGHGIEVEYSSSPDIINNTLHGNGKNGLYIKNGSSPVVKNNIITGNAGYGIATFALSFPSVSYNDVWNNSDGDYYDHDTEGPFTPLPGTGELSVDPLYENVLADDYHPAAGSPVIDAGDPTSDYSNEPLPNGGRINMGAYGNTVEVAVNDEDVDGLIDSWELAYFGNLDQTGTDDFDNDNLINEDEETAGTDPTSQDTDGDGTLDGDDPCPLFLPARIAGVNEYYLTIQDAYDNSISGDVIQSQESMQFVGDLIIDLFISVTLEGGYNCNYTTVIGNTSIYGSMTIYNGEMKVGNIIIE